MTKIDPLSPLMTALVLETFRLNGALLAAGDDLVADLGLTSARWQVLGAVSLAGRPLTMAQVARRMGLTRQAVQRVTKDLVQHGFVTLEPNPDHKRARLIRLSARGEAAATEAHHRQATWMLTLGAGVETARVADALALLRLIHDRCRAADAAPEVNDVPCAAPSC